MHDDPLERLLQHADRAAGEAPPATANLADRIWHTKRVRRRNRRVALVASVGVGLLAVGWVFQSWQGGSTSTQQLTAELPTATNSRVDRLRALVDALALEADSRAAVARRVTTLRQSQIRQASYQQELNAPDPIAEVRRLIDQASLIMVTQADRMHREFGLTESSARRYARTIELFPRAVGAAYARHKLKEMPNSNGDLL